MRIPNPILILVSHSGSVRGSPNPILILVSHSGSVRGSLLCVADPASRKGGVITSVQARLIRQISTDSGTMEFSHQTILDPPPCQCLLNFQGRIQDFVLGRTKFGEGPGDRLSSQKDKETRRSKSKGR